jgi:hypothetical protein
MFWREFVLSMAHIYQKDVGGSQEAKLAERKKYNRS